MSSIRNYIETHILHPLKQYPTVIQDTMFEIIADKLEELYNYSWRFPSIISPDKNRLDILKAIADQFLFTVRDEADIREQIDILDKILYVYNRRGSIETIENMWKYYGGDLPKDVKVIIPSYNLFRYSISPLSGTHSFVKGKILGEATGVDRTVNTSGVYEIRLTNNTYPIPDLREFLLKELVAAGNEIYFTNALHMQVDEGIDGSNHYIYGVRHENFFNLQLDVLKSTNNGLTLSSNSYHSLSNSGDLSSWSGGGSIFLELTKLLRLDTVKLPEYLVYELVETKIRDYKDIVYRTRATLYKYIYSILHTSYATSSDRDIWSHLPDSQESIVEYHGYFVLGKTHLDADTYEITIDPTPTTEYVVLGKSCLGNCVLS